MEHSCLKCLTSVELIWFKTAGESVCSTQKCRLHNSCLCSRLINPILMWCGQAWGAGAGLDPSEWFCKGGEKWWESYTERTSRFRLRRSCQDEDNASMKWSWDLQISARRRRREDKDPDLFSFLFSIPIQRGPLPSGLASIPLSLVILVV